MSRTSRINPWRIAAALGIGTLALYPATADTIATSDAQITNIQYGLVDPGAGTINWFYNNGAGGPAWQGEAWAEACDSLGGTGAGYNVTPDGAGLISTSAVTSLASGHAWVNVLMAQLYAYTDGQQPAGGWSTGAALGLMYNYFSVAPSRAGSRDPIEMTFSLDYTIHLTGQADPGARYYSDANASMLLQGLDLQGNWQPVPGGQLSVTRLISGTGRGGDDQTFNGHLVTSVWVTPDTTYSEEIQVKPDVPEPTALLLLLAGGLVARRR